MCERIVKAELESTQKLQVEEIENAYGVEVLEIINTSSGVQPTLINGRPVNRADWPEVVRIRVNGGGCTATIVGPNCAITAAHCGGHGAEGSLELYDQSRVRFTVTQMPQYNSNGASYDLSVLKLHSDVDVPFAAVGLDHQFNTGDHVLLAGYGCTRIGGGGGNDGILRIGPSKIVGSSGTDIVSRWREQNGAALCFGDSGGPMFQEQATAGARVLIAVNSKGNIRDTNYNMRLDLSEVRDFLTRTASSQNLKIKGLNFSGNGSGGGGGNGDAREVLRALVKELKDVTEKVNELENVIG